MQRDDNKGGKTMKITKRQLRRIIKEEKAKLVSERFDMSDPRLLDFADDVERAFFKAMQAGADIGDLRRVVETFMADLG